MVTCYAGFYCPEGTPAPLPCPAGTYGSSGGKAKPDDCQPCDAGFYCDVSNLTAVVAPCDAGYYCPVGSILPNNVSCDPGYHCPVGSANQIECNSGSFQAKSAQATCDDCPEGKYCPTLGAVITPLDCPVGQYCPLKSSSGINCPAGRYNDKTNLTSPDECLPCLPRYFCSAGSVTGQGTGLCGAGYYCDGGAEDSQQHACPIGTYCVEGSSSPTPCPLGTITGTTGPWTNETDCTPCPPGKYCNSSNADGLYPDCDPGFFCTGGASVPNPTDSSVGGKCPAGSACPTGSGSPTECDLGYFQPEEGKFECVPCTAGSYCDSTGMAAALPCPAGQFCDGEPGKPEGNTGGIGCPKGTYSNTTGLVNADECTGCPPGR